MMNLIKVSWRNFVRNKSRFKVLISATIVAVALMIIMLSYISGVTDLLRLKASRYFSGDIAIQSFEKDKLSKITEPEKVKELMDELNLPISGLTMRSIFYSPRSNLFFNGFYAKQRRLIGIEWELEKNVFQYLDFTEGGFPESDYEESILISTASADRLQVSVGDRVTIFLETDQGMRNTESLIVKGIFREESFFGYASYLDRRTLNRISRSPEEQVNEMGVYLKNAGDQNYVETLLREKLDQYFDVFPEFETRADRSQAIAGDWDGFKYAIVPLNLQVDEIQDLIDAMSTVSYIIFVIFMLIVIIGVSNTYSIIIVERIKEIGTLRALGLTKNKTMFVIVLEAVFLGLVSMLVGSVLGMASLYFLDWILYFEGSNLLSLFLAGNNLPWQVSIESVLIVCLITVGATLLGSIRPAYRASNFSPVDAMRQN